VGVVGNFGINWLKKTIREARLSPGRYQSQQKFETQIKWARGREKKNAASKPKLQQGIYSLGKLGMGQEMRQTVSHPSTSKGQGSRKKDTESKGTKGVGTTPF